MFTFLCSPCSLSIMPHSLCSRTLISFLWLCHTWCLYRSHLPAVGHLGHFHLLAAEKCWVSMGVPDSVTGTWWQQWEILGHSGASPLYPRFVAVMIWMPPYKLSGYWLVLSVLQPARSHPFLVSGGALPCPFFHCGCEDLVLSWSPLIAETSSAATDLYILRPWELMHLLSSLPAREVRILFCLLLLW